MKDNKLYQDLMTLLSLIRSCESSSINSILPAHLKKQSLLSSPSYANSSLQIQQIILKYSKQNNELIIKFWITLRQIIIIFLEKIKLIGVDNSMIIRKYNMVIDIIFRNIENKMELNKLRYIIDLLKNQNEIEIMKQSQDIYKKDNKKDKQISRPFPLKSKSNNKPPKSKSKSPSKRLQKPNPISTLISNKDITKIIQTNLKTNNKLFKSIDAKLSLDKYDSNLNRSSNSYILFNELYQRNKHAYKSIIKYHNKSSSIPKQVLNLQENNYCEVETGKRKESPGVYKSKRKSHVEMKNQPILTFQINVITNNKDNSNNNKDKDNKDNNNKRIEKIKNRPQSCKQNKRKQLNKNIKCSCNGTKENIMM